MSRQGNSKLPNRVIVSREHIDAIKKLRDDRCFWGSIIIEDTGADTVAIEYEEDDDKVLLVLTFL